MPFVAFLGWPQTFTIPHLPLERAAEAPGDPRALSRTHQKMLSLHSEDGLFWRRLLDELSLTSTGN